MEAAKPIFIDYPGSIMLSLPIEEKYTQIYGFCLQGDLSAIQKLVDQRLNFMSDRPDIRYIVASDKVLCSFTSSVNGRSTGLDIKMGYASEDALLTFIVLAKCTKNGNDWDAQELVLFAPFTFVDNPLSMAVGREMYGFPKSIGIFDMPTDPQFVNNLTLSAVAFKTFNEEARAYMQPIVSINKEVGNNPELTEEITDSKLSRQPIIEARLSTAISAMFSL